MAPSRDPRKVIHAAFTQEIPHMSVDEAVADFPAKHFNTKPPNVPYSFWHLLEHIGSLSGTCSNTCRTPSSSLQWKRRCSSL